MQLRGNRILLNKPEAIDLESVTSIEEKETLKAQTIAAWNALQVFAVGDEVINFIVGDTVKLSKDTISNIETIDVNGVPKLLIREPDIVIKW